MTAYLVELSDDFITINADDSTDRRSRASQISALKRRQENETGATLTLISKSYSETPGFLSRSTFRYSVARTVPAQASPYVADPSNPTDAELSAAIQRGLESGAIITAEQFLASVADDARQLWFADSLSSVTFHALTSGHAACVATFERGTRTAYTVEELPDSARPCDACNDALRVADDTQACVTRNAPMTGQLVCTRCAPDCEHYVCIPADDKPASDWVGMLEIPASDACTCGTPSKANFYASGVILGDDFTEELSDYLCADHAPGHRASVRETLGHGESLVEYELTELR